MLIGLVGLKGCGKDTVAKTLIYEYRFRKYSFAGPLKDIASILFGFDRKMLEGDTTTSRKWREEPNRYWSKVLGRNVSPRSLLQELGTEVFRNNFNENIWVECFKNKLLTLNDNVVITDVRFGNEMKAIKDMGGVLIRIKRGEDPGYILDAIASGEPPEDDSIHTSELDWALNYNLIDYSLENNGTLGDLQDSIRGLAEHFGLNSSEVLELTDAGITRLKQD